MTEAQIIDTLLTFIAADGASDDDFNALALELFAYQFENNQPFRRFCQQREKTARTVKHWRDIPAVPIDAFKDLTLSCCAPEDAERIFMTSGTTQDGVRGKSHHPTMDVWNASMRRNFKQHFMPDRDRIRMGILFPGEKTMPNSSLAHYLALAVEEFGTEDSHYLVDESGLDTMRVMLELAHAEQSGEPYALLGASFSFVHLMDALKENDEIGFLPAGSRLLDTGGFKGQSREMELDEFYRQLSTTFGVPRSQCINMYGMTELSSQFYDAGNEACPSVKYVPHWMRTRVVNPLTNEDLPRGEKGVLAHCDLAHFNVVSTILTEDAGVETDDGFLLLGRADGADSQGCSMAVEEFLKAAKG